MLSRVENASKPCWTQTEEAAILDNCPRNHVGPREGIGFPRACFQFTLKVGTGSRQLFVSPHRQPLTPAAPCDAAQPVQAVRYELRVKIAR